MTPDTGHVEPLSVPDMGLQPSNIALSSVVFHQEVAWSSPPPSAWSPHPTHTIIATPGPLSNVSLAESPGQPFGIVTHSSPSHPPGHLLAGQLPRGHTPA